MKAPITILFCLVILLGCKNDGKLTFEPQTITDDACEECPEISIEMPKVLDQTKLAETINTALDEELISLLVYDDGMEATTVSEAIQSFKNGYDELQKLYPDETVKWEAKITGTVSYENKNVLTIALNSYLFTGGAHGYTTRRFLNFDKNKGMEIENRELFKDRKDFEHFAETKFRIQEDIPLDEPINSTGFMFEGDTFYLPENIGFTEEGMVLLYNQYEVASYADGAITLVLPFNEIKNYLTHKIGE
ncbi:DUF3298 and DUF4163 domain-containing protein [Maribacter polysiphoniae]|uniref:DUF3298 and DUF4163 domain-containing protein n=1 Tax=Maribacter polysiphoniae TaxID=429344 RepID=A0A316ERK8_9FLAO|nr:DUF3298 and DUF4163 domain-containing protein [Maribacter polysiphoniae]MBD1260258.1 DUF3298 and DUF4163 domain-containing protein [Maribacter polysiphoniae]PWK25720.1 uncharacterized protein DUF3298 [Maribacter polysiphoniae]